ncbi:MAG TPA: efflux RND transporter periplasmic adaptor subunit [Chitinophagaceae bacterium]|nr:efflux RND transporter periplasmic adaptor subunit [Chitinophagaceae bacterium]
MNKKNGEKSNSIKTAFSRNQANFIFIVIAAVILYACNSSSGNSAHMQQPPPALPVVAVSSMPATTYQEYSASIEGSKDIEIRPQVEGYLEKIYVDEGAYVRKGQSLFQINSRPYREQLNNATAALSAAKANLANAEINVSKLTPLVQNNVISDVQLKTAKTAYDAASANVAQAQAAVGNAQINLGYALIKAPVDGYVGRIPFKMGSLVGMSTTEALTVISDIKEVYAYFSLSENDFQQFKNQFAGNTIEEKIKKMPPVELVLPDGSIYAQKGKVQLVAGQFDNSTGAISFRAAFPNTDRQLRSGNTGKVRVSKVLNAALVVPQEATFEIQDKVFVFAVGDSNKVASKPITVAGRTAHYYFVDGGVQAGEKIVFSGTGTLQDGMVIVPQPISTDSLLKAKPL